MARTIAKDYRIFSSTIILLVALLVGGLWAGFDYRHLQYDAQARQKQLLTSSKILLQERVQRAVNYLTYTGKQTKKRLKKNIRERTYEACATAAGLVKRYKGKLDQDLLHSIVRDSLRNIRYNGERGYFFAVNMDGTGELISDKPEQEGKQFSNLLNSDEQNIVQDMLTLARESGEGFYQYTWTKPGSDTRDHIKIAFIKFLPELDWLIGTGEYLEDVEQDLQQEILQRLDAVRFGIDEKEYIFVATYDGISLTGPAKGRNMLNIQDANGLFIVRELIKQAKNGGGFVQYVMPEFKGKRQAPKLSYVSGIPEWHWYIGTGEYIDTIDAQLEALSEKYRANLQKHLLYITAITLIIFLFNLLIVNFFSKKLQMQTSRFVDFFRQAAVKPVTLDESSFVHKEFRSIALAANGMLVERNRALQESRDARDHWVRTFSAIQDSILLFDAQGTCIQMNSAAEQLFADNDGEIIGSHYRNFLCEENLVDRCRQDLKVHHDHIDTLISNKVFACSCYPLVSNDDTLDYAIYILADVTNQRNLEEQLAQSQRLESIGRLAGGVAHDFNNILSAIIGNIELCLLTTDKNNPLYERLKQIEQSGLRAARLTKQLLAFSRREIIYPELMDLGEEVAELNEMLPRLLGEHVEIVTRVQKELWPVKMDRGQFEQLLINLAVNGRDAMNSGGTLSIELTNTFLDSSYVKDRPEMKSGDYIMLGITDTGTGMSQEVTEHIFEPFFTTKEQGKGTGLGLATVHGIVKQNKGEIFVYSELGKGTTFKVYLPRCLETGSPPVTNISDASKQEIPRGTETILMVEDDNDVRDMLTNFLSDLGYTVLEAEDGKDALQICSKYQDNIDLLLTDVVMPRMSGPELVNELGNTYPDLIVLYMSGYTENAIVHHGVLEDGINFLHKPISPTTLAHNLRELFEK